MNFRLERKECYVLVVQAVMEGEGQRAQASPNLVWPPKANELHPWVLRTSCKEDHQTVDGDLGRNVGMRKVE